MEQARKFSPTKLALFKECPTCFYCEVNGIPVRYPTIFPSLPAGMDAILKDLASMYRCKNHMPYKFGIPQQVKFFNDHEKLREWRNQWQGVRYTNERGHTLFGAVDDIVEIDGKLCVVDYKTRGFPLKEDTAAHYQDQLNVYTYLLQKNGHATTDFAFLVFWYPRRAINARLVDFSVEVVKMPIDVHRAEQLFDDAVACANGRMPTRRCKFCQHIPV
jgi:hypothetical protein